MAVRQVAAVEQPAEGKGKEEEKAGVGLAERWAEGTAKVAPAVVVVASLVAAEATVALVAARVVGDAVAALEEMVVVGVAVAVARAALVRARGQRPSKRQSNRPATHSTPLAARSGQLRRWLRKMCIGRRHLDRLWRSCWAGYCQ